MGKVTESGSSPIVVPTKTSTPKEPPSAPPEKPVAQPMRQANFDRVKQSGGAKQTAKTAPAPVSKAPAEPTRINATVYNKSDGFHFDFASGLEMTKDKVAKLIFKDGKIPPGATIVRAPLPALNEWIVKIDPPDSMQVRENVVKHFSAHLETSHHSRPSETSFTWVVGGPLPVPKPMDPWKDHGFMVTKKYRLDEGQIPMDQVMKGLGRGEGLDAYEVAFKKPMTKQEVMDKLFRKNAFAPGEVNLVPIGGEPTTQWKIELIGAGAQGAFKPDLDKAFRDTKESLPPDIPAGPRAHYENKTIPAGTKEHPPNTYVWEQDGYIMHVVTNGKKGKERTYQFEATKLPKDEESQIWMRHYMIEKRMPPRAAWKEFSKDTIETAKMRGTMVGGAGRLPRAPHVPGRIPMSRPTGVTKDTTVPKVDVAKGPTGTVVGTPKPPAPPPPRPVNPKLEPIPDRNPARGGARPLDTTRRPGVAYDDTRPGPPPAIPGKGKTLPGSLTEKTGGPAPKPPEIPSFPKKPGTEMTKDQVIGIHKIDRNRVVWSQRADHHERRWKSENPGAKGPAPIAFTTRDGTVQVDEARWIKAGNPAIWGR